MKSENFLLVFLNIWLVISAENIEPKKQQLKVFTVASEQTDGYNRYIRSANHYGIQVETLGMGKPWRGGDMTQLGGGYKINLLRNALESMKDNDEQLILFTDSYDVIFMSELDDILTKFKNTGARILFSAERFCWPEPELHSAYPTVGDGQVRFLNSGMFIGYANDIYTIIDEKRLKDTDDDQMYYTRVFLDETVRTKHKIKLDHKSKVFQNLNGATAEVKLEFDYLTGEAFISNLEFQTRPNILHGNGPTKILLNSFGNYLAGSWTNEKCHTCTESVIELKDDDSLPMITMALFIERPMPFLDEFFEIIYTLDYPKDRLKIFLHNAVAYHKDVVNKWIGKFEKVYSNLKTILPEDNVAEADARNLAVTYAQQRKTDYLFVVDAESRLDNPHTLKELLHYNRTIISPMIVRPGEVWSNFWGSINEQGYYARSHDYMDIVKDNIRGLWNVPFITSTYLIKSTILPKISYDDAEFDAEMTMCKNLRSQGIFMYTVNTDFYGHLINPDEYNIKHTRPDFYMLLTNRADWEQRYIHPEYIEAIKPNFTFNQPCPDVYWIPIATEQFCDDLVAIMEGFGKWSDGSNNDTRLQNGYEAVPTRDIHMNQVGLEGLWLKFLKLYIQPIQETIFIGYYHNPPHSLMNFVVRYRPTEQPYLRPHHDSSTYTINIALNRAGIDYEGGGCRFLRYNCSIADTKKGWMLMHPGRLTHFHEGMKTISGTRYIMISFIDP